MLDEAIEYLKQLQLQVQVSFLSLKMNNEALKHVKLYFGLFYKRYLSQQKFFFREESTKVDVYG